MLEIIAFTDTGMEKIEFTDIKKKAESISKLVFLWDYNSYVVDIRRHSFIINGGREFDLQGTEGLEFICLRRKQQEIGLNGKAKTEPEVTAYLLGFHGIMESEKKEIYLKITADGRQWYWLDKR